MFKKETIFTIEQYFNKQYDLIHAELAQLINRVQRSVRYEGVTVPYFCEIDIKS